MGLSVNEAIIVSNNKNFIFLYNLIQIWSDLTPDLAQKCANSNQAKLTPCKKKRGKKRRKKKCLKKKKKKKMR
jgi:hypothetical protein